MGPSVLPKADPDPYAAAHRTDAHRPMTSRRHARLIPLLLAMAGLSMQAIVGGAAGPPAPPPDGAGAPPAAAQVVPGSETRAVVVFVTRIINSGQAPLRGPEIHLHAPIRSPHQDIAELDVEGDPERLTDRWGAPVLHYRREQLSPGAVMVGRWTAWAAIRRFRWDWSRQDDSRQAALPSEERLLNLRDGKVLALSDPVIRAASEQAARGKEGIRGVLDGVFGLVMDRLSYDRDGKWQPAPEVLTSGKGSCSEFTYCFIALCRKSDIPARYVGGIVGRTGVPFHLDKVFHRFPQAHVPGLGWVDFDPTRTDRAANRRLYFGQTPGPMLLLSVGDGGDGSLTGADYLESHAWEDRRGRAASLRQAWWFPPPSSAIRARVEEFRRRLDAAQGEQRPGLVGEALAIGHPFVLPWLDDLLYENGTRVAAAGACLRIGGSGELAAIVNCLERLNDTDGDRRIAQLLEKHTGQQLGTSRVRWNEWLKAQTPRTPLPGDTPGQRP